MAEKDKTAANRKEIEAWLKSKEKDFDAGFELFVRFSHNRALAMQLARKRRLPKLEYELQKISKREFIKESRVWPIAPVVKAGNRNQEHVKNESLLEGTEKKMVVTDERINYDDLPEDLKKLYDQNRETYKLMRAVHEKMKLAKKDGERAKLREELVQMDDLIAGNWEKLDKWASGEKVESKNLQEIDGNNESQEPESNPEPDPMKLGKDLNACRSYLSRNVKKVAGLKGESREKLIEKLADRVKILRDHKADLKESTRQELINLGLWDENNGNA